MKLKSRQKISKNEIKQIFDEELVKILTEELASGRIDEGFLDHMKSAGKGLVSYYNTIFTSYAKMLDDMVNQQLIPSAMGQKIEDKVDDMDKPEEFKGDSPEEQADAVADLEDLISQTAKAADSAGADKAADKMQDMADAAGEVEKAAEKKAEEGGGEPGEAGDAGGAGGEESDEKIKAAVLDLIDATNEKWDAIQKNTTDDNLKKSMEYMEKVALSERLLKEIFYQLGRQAVKNNKLTNKRKR
jgi:hypothetical protein